MMTFRTAILFCLTGMLSLAPADSMELNGTTVNGMFQSCRKGIITFMDFQSNKPVTAVFSDITKIRFDKPMSATFILLSDSKKLPKDCKIKGYSAKNGFSLLVDGEKQLVRANHLAKLEVHIGIKEFADAREAFMEGGENKSGGVKPQKVSRIIPKGKAALVHFDDASAPSARQGNLCRRLCSEKARGKILYIQLPCTVGSDMAEKNGIRSTPQFWFVKADGTISAKLTETFTEEQIAHAFDQLKKGR